MSRVLARELLAVGCNLNFAPVLDLNNNPDNFAVGIRAFGDRPADVARMGIALIAGMQDAGVIATAKHFFAGSRILAHDVAVRMRKAHGEPR